MTEEPLAFVEEDYEEAVFEAQTIEGDNLVMGAGWRLAESLVVLRNECNAKAPYRKKGSDGTIGNTAHAANASRHNPNNSGVVCALDITHDPANGMDTYKMFDIIRKNPHPNCEYVVSNKRIASRGRNWEVRAYTGQNPHIQHIHVGVGVGPDSEPRQPYDDKNPWGIASLPTPSNDYLKKGSKGQRVKELQTKLASMGWTVTADGIFGDRTDALVRSFQGSKGLPVDGIVGPNTIAAFSKTDRVLKTGLKGVDVVWVQRILSRVLKISIKPDGDFGKNTEKAVIAFQKKNKMVGDGIVGPNTWYQLRRQSN